MVCLQAISKSFGEKTVIRDFSLDLKAGERFTLLGRSGCGKTTLLRLIAGFEQPDHGNILIEDQNVLPLPIERRPVGFIFQTYALFPHMNVYDNIAVGPRIRHISESEIAKRIDDLLEITRLKELRHAYPHRLSGGESQRVAIARAIINQPKILLLDEPLSALDPNLRQALRSELVEIQKALGITFLFVTHDQEEAMSLATRMGIMEDGRLLQVGTPADLFDRPQSPFVAQFLGDINRFPGIIEKQNDNKVTVSLPGVGVVECLTDKQFTLGGPVACFIRPERISFPKEGSGDHTCNVLEGILTGKEFFGSYTLYKIRLDNGEVLTVSVRPGEPGQRAEELRNTDRIQIQFRMQDVLLF